MTLRKTLAAAVAALPLVVGSASAQEPQDQAPRDEGVEVEGLKRPIDEAHLEWIRKRYEQETAPENIVPPEYRSGDRTPDEP